MSSSSTSGKPRWRFKELHGAYPSQDGSCLLLSPSFWTKSCPTANSTKKRRCWWTEGFIQTTNAKEDMEAVGRDYFHELLATAFVQQGYYKGRLCYFIHDLMHDLAEQAAASDCFRIENNLKRKIPSDVCHLFVAYGSLLTEEIFELENLRTLIVEGMGWEWPVPVNELFEKVFVKLKKLRVLVVGVPLRGLTDNTVLNIPGTIGHLKHLRYLALKMPFGKLVLPKTLDNLYHMQALVFDFPIPVKISPDTSMGNLTNLRHITGLITLYVPDIGELTSLQTLPALLLWLGSSYGLEQLRYLNKLLGNLEISGLERAKSKKEAQEAKLADKKGLTSLKLSWALSYSTPEVQAEVLEGLCPPNGLKCLTIGEYQSLRYPSWMVGEQTGGPKYLHELTLYKCSRLRPAPELFEFFIHLHKFAIEYCNWDHLPENLKDLRSLKRLKITSCLYLKSLPELPPSLQKLKVFNCNTEFMTSCQQIDHPNWQKIQHIEVKQFLVKYDYRSWEDSILWTELNKKSRLSLGYAANLPGSDFLIYVLLVIKCYILVLSCFAKDATWHVSLQPINTEFIRFL